MHLSLGIQIQRIKEKDGALATIKAHDPWEDVYIIPGNDSICTSCKIMTIPAASTQQKKSPDNFLKE